MHQDFFDKNDDYLNEFKQKVAEQKIATLEERRTELARSRNNFLGTFAGILLAGIVGWFVLAPQYQQGAKDVPTIHRPQTAVKIKPENPGGMDIPNQDKDVYNIVEKKNVDNTVVENLLPSPEVPRLPDIAPETLDIDENAQNLDEIVDEVEEENTETASDNISAQNAETMPEKPADLLSDDTKVNEEKIAEQTVNNDTKEAAPAPQLQAAASGNWQIQLVASKNKAAVEQTWKTLSEKYATLKNQAHEIQEADLGAQGKIYKLRAGAFNDKEAAQKLCNELKAAGLNDCITKERDK